MSDAGARFTDVEVENKRLPACNGYIGWRVMRIEDATQDLNMQIPEIRRFVKDSKKLCTYPNDDELSKDESAAIYLYTTETAEDASVYHLLNRALRAEDRTIVRPWFAYLKLLDSAVSKLPNYKGTVWRGVPKDVSTVFNKGQKITWWSVSSCSKSVAIISGFINKAPQSTLFNIQCVAGKCISAYTCYPNEDEVILMPGTTFEVVDKPLHHHGGLNIVHLREIADDDSDEDVTPQGPKAKSAYASSTASVTQKINKISFDDEEPKYATASSSTAPKGDKPPPPKTKAGYQEFAPPGTCEELGCEGRPCAKCRKCRDWHFTGDRDTWNWITNCENWTQAEWKRYDDNRVYDLFTKRDAATCYGGYAAYYRRAYAGAYGGGGYYRRAYAGAYGGGGYAGAYRLHVCVCEFH